LCDLPDRAFLARGNGFDDRARKCNTGREREARPRRLPKTDRFRAEDRIVARLHERDDLFHASTVTSPASPSTRTSGPSAMRSVASRVPTTPGMPYSRATIAEWESRPPLSV